jgi:PleD family two-component response regulator
MKPRAVLRRLMIKLAQPVIIQQLTGSRAEDGAGRLEATSTAFAPSASPSASESSGTCRGSLLEYWTGRRVMTMYTEPSPPTVAPTAQKVVVVNGSPEILQLLENVLDAGHYDMVFVESSAHAYSRIKHVQPDLVILCVDLRELEGFHLLSMLKLDDETRRIPIVTYAGDAQSDGDEDDDADESGDDELPAVTRPTITMN